MKFEVTILGSGAAIPANGKGTTSQILNIQEGYYLIDCGEGTQFKLRRQKIGIQKIKAIFISHLHGDHYFGLVGLLSSMHLLGRTMPLNVYAPEGLEEIINIQLKYSGTGVLSYPLHFHVNNTEENNIIYENNQIEVSTIPLKHKIPCCGFLFKEKPKKRKMLVHQILKYHIPHYALDGIKMGDDFNYDGKIIPNNELTSVAPKSYSYAFCSDTAYYNAINPIIKNVDLLYHESTFTEAHNQRAKKTFHSTAKDAATIAKEANVGKLLLGHFSARYKDISVFEQEAKQIFNNSFTVNDGQKFIVY